jgi:transcriptional regulator with XRE-family HTH domain
MISRKLLEKLSSEEYRKAFVASQISIGIPFQIRALQKSRGWTQEQFAERAGMLQPRISTIRKPGNGSLNLDTLRRLAEAFDCGLMVRFVPFSELAGWSEDFDPENFSVPSFEEEKESHAFEDSPQNAVVAQEATANVMLTVSSSENAKTENDRDFFRERATQIATGGFNLLAAASQVQKIPPVTTQTRLSESTWEAA